MNWTLYRQGLKSSWKPFVIFAAVLTMYFAIIVTMFDPEMGSALKELEKVMPELLSIVGMTTTDSTLVGFLASYLYGFIMLVFPMVYAIIAANTLVAKQVDSGGMAYLLAAPVSRFKIVFTQMKVMATGSLLLVAYAGLVGLVTSSLYFPDALDIPKFLLVNLGALALHLFISGICFFFSCLCNDARYSLAFGAGIPALSYIIQMAANAGEAMENAKYATFFTLFDPHAIVAGESGAYAGIAILAVGGLALYAAACIVFVKKDIPV